MPPAAPIVEQIAAAIANQLATITAGDDYLTTVAQVVRPSIIGAEGFRPRDLALVLTQDDPIRDTENDSIGNPNAIAWMQPFHVDCYRSAVAGDGPIDTKVNAIHRDVVAALMADVTWGGLAINTFLMEPERFFTDDHAFDGVRVIIHVQYRVAENDPSVNRK